MLRAIAKSISGATSAYGESQMASTCPRAKAVSDNDAWLNVSQVALITGESAAVWRKRILHREIPFAKLGRNVRINRKDLQAWVKSRTVPVQQSAIAAHAMKLRRPAAPEDLA